MSATARAREEAAALDLTTLRLMSFKELDALYRAGKRPSALSGLDGDAIGAMLAWRTPATGPLAWLLRSFGASTAFPWEGKTFQSQTSEIGEGINRVKKHTRITTTQRGAKSGGIEHIEAPINASNVMVIDSEGKATRVGYRRDDESGRNVRTSRRSGKDLS